VSMKQKQERTPLSFSQRVKQEICEKKPRDPCCLASELYGVLLFAHTFSRREIRIITKSAAFAKRITLLFAQQGLSSALQLQHSKEKHVFLVEDKDAIAGLFSTFGIDYDRYLYPTIHGNIIEKTCCKTAFLRGVFLSAAFIVDPEKDVRLEFLTTSQHLTRQLQSFFLDLSLNPKMGRRGNYYLLYFQDSDAIEELLATLQAHNAQMELINAKILRAVSNKANRQANCDVANTMKSFANATGQINAIQKIQSEKGLSALDEKLRYAAELRLSHPDLSLSELCAVSKEPISKSGLNYRLRRIQEIAATLSRD